jgi:hypothetical protein
LDAGEVSGTWNRDESGERCYYPSLKERAYFEEVPADCKSDAVALHLHKADILT